MTTRQFLDLLRKLGVIRYGAKTATYTSGKDRPIEFMVDGVYNAEKELTTKEDLKQIFGKSSGNAPLPATSASCCLKCGAATKPGAKFCASCGAPLGAPSMPGCSKCGATFKPGAKFCSSCGAAVAASATAPAIQPAVSLSRKNWVLPMILVIAGVTGFAIIVAVITGSINKRSGMGRNEVAPITTASMDPAVQTQVQPDIASAGQKVEQAIPKPVAGTVNADELSDKVRSWTPKSTMDVTAGPPKMEYDTYANKKFGFATELPAHWDSEVKDNAQVFSGRKGTEQYDTTVNFQFIIKKEGTNIRNQADEILAQWKTMKGFTLDQIKQGDMDGRDALYMVASYSLPNGEAFQQMQVIIQREPYYYMIGYTAPKDLFRKYYFVVVHLLEKFKFIAMEKSAE